MLRDCKPGYLHKHWINTHVPKSLTVTVEWDGNPKLQMLSQMPNCCSTLQKNADSPISAPLMCDSAAGKQLKAQVLTTTPCGLCDRPGPAKCDGKLGEYAPSGELYTDKKKWQNHHKCVNSHFSG